MADAVDHPDQTCDKLAIAHRLVFVRRELYGDEGIPDLAAELGIPSGTWANYELGVTVPAEVVLLFIEITLANPIWLLRGTGPRYTDIIGPAILPAICLN